MTFRGFISVDIEANDEIKKFIEELERTRAPLKMVGSDKIHMTIKFLGDTEREKVNDIAETVRDILTQFDPFHLNIKGVGAFPHLDYMKVVWIGIKNEDEITDIAHEVEEEMVPLGFSRMDKGFSPHITVARVKGGKNKGKLQSVLRQYQDHDFGEQKVTKLKLKESILKKSGPEYKTLEEMYL